MNVSSIKLWFDVGIKRYTTHEIKWSNTTVLWFDVGIKRYTTPIFTNLNSLQLWFDVGIKRYTTNSRKAEHDKRCGLM